LSWLVSNRDSVMKFVSCFVVGALLCAVAFGAVRDSGNCNEEGSCLWEYADNVLTISGDGVMDNYTDAGTPWKGLYGAIQSVVIKDGVPAIGDNAFCNASELAAVEIPTSVTFIGYRAFGGCPKLEKFELNDFNGVIGNEILRDCSSLGSVVIDGVVSEIGYGLFFKCGSLENVTIKSTPSIPDQLFARSQYLDSLKYVSVGDVTYLGTAAFEDSDVLGVTLSNFNSPIPYHAFFSCDKMAELNIEGTVISVGDEAFGNCLLVQSLTFEGFNGPIGNNAFENCAALGSVVINGVVTSLGFTPFASCSALENLTIASLNSIPPMMFSGLLLKHVSIGGVTDVGSNAFSGCVNLIDIELPRFNGTVGTDAFRGLASLVSVDFDGTVRSFSNYPFDFCTSLERLSITTIEIIGDDFFRASPLKHVVLGGVQSIGEHAFAECQNLEDVLFVGFNGSISTEAFKDCPNLISADIDGVTSSIGSHAFDGCSSLKDVRVHGVESIDEFAFYHCIALTTFLSEAPLKSIGVSAFEGCTELTSVNLVSSIETIADAAFKNCSKLTDVSFAGTKDPGENSTGVFEGCDLLESVYVPSNYNSEAFCGKKVVKVESSHSSAVNPSGTSSASRVSFVSVVVLAFILVSALLL